MENVPKLMLRQVLIAWRGANGDSNEIMIHLTASTILRFNNLLKGLEFPMSHQIDLFIA